MGVGTLAWHIAETKKNLQRMWQGATWRQAMAIGESTMTSVEGDTLCGRRHVITQYLDVHRKPFGEIDFVWRCIELREGYGTDMEVLVEWRQWKSIWEQGGRPDETEDDAEARINKAYRRVMDAADLPAGTNFLTNLDGLADEMLEDEEPSELEPGSFAAKLKSFLNRKS